MTARVRQEWHGARVNREVKTSMRGKLRRAGGEARKTLREKVSTRSRRSSPGQPPGRRTGTLMRSIRYRTRGRGSQLALRLFATAWYAKLLERGTQKMRARPFFEGTMVEFAKNRFPQILRGR